MRPLHLESSTLCTVLRAFRCFPALAAILALSLIAGPAASALCAHVELGGHEMAGHGEAPMEMPAEAPCHGTPAHERPGDGAPGDEDRPDGHSGADCDAPCCVAPADRVAPAPALSVPMAVERVAQAEVVWTPERAVTTTVEGKPPPPRLYQETGRIRI